jgi:trigger factor
MKSNIKILGECQREIELDIEADEVMKEFDRIVTQFSSTAKIPGFRPGKAPRDIIKQRFYPEIKESLINSLVPKALNGELRTQNLNPVGLPVVNDLRFKEGEPLHLKAQFEVWPEFSLPEYKKIKVKSIKISVTDEEINQSLEDLRLRSAQYVPVEGRGVLEGDYVVADLKGKDLKTKKSLPQEKVVILAGHAENEEILNKKLIGSRPGEEKNFTIDYDKNHQNKKLAGKKIEYNLKVISIKEKKLPLLDDEFAKELGEYKSLKELKEKIRTEIISSKEKAAKQDMAEEIIKKISDKLSIGLPETLVEQEYAAVMRRHLSYRTQQDIKKEDLEQLKSEGKKKARENLKNHLILKKIAEKENLKVSDQEMNQEFKEIAKTNNIPLAQVIDTVNKEGKKEELRSSILFKKTVDFLVEQAIIE